MPEPKLSVVQIIDRLETGGAEKIVVLLSNLLHCNGHRVRVITTVSNGPQLQFLHKDISTVCLRRKWKWNPRYMLRLKRACRGFDVIHLHGEPTLRYSFLTKTLFGLKGGKIYHEHYPYVNQRPVKWYLKYMLRNTQIIATSQMVADWAIHKVKLEENRITKLMNTVERSEPKTNRACGSHSLVQVSNLLPHKNIAFSIDVLKALIRISGQDFHLTFIGKKYDERHFNSLKKKTEDENLSQNIDFIFDCDNVAPLLDHFSFGLHSSPKETGPVVLAEYFASKLPFLAFRTGEVSDLLFRHFPEFFMTDLDAEQWAIRIIELLKQQQKNPAENQRMEEVFDRYFSSRQYYSSYNKLLLGFNQPILTSN